MDPRGAISKRSRWKPLGSVLRGAALALLLLAGCARENNGAAAMQRAADAATSEARVDARVPRQALEVYEYVLRTGRAPRGYVGGRAFENREGRLDPGGDYHEYDVHPKLRGVNRGPERLIVDWSSRRGWYTGDHYRTFLPLPRRSRDR